MNECSTWGDGHQYHLHHHQHEFISSKLQGSMELHDSKPPRFLEADHYTEGPVREDLGSGRPVQTSPGSAPRNLDDAKL